MTNYRNNHLRLGDVCRFQNGRAFKPTDWSCEGLPIIRIQNLNNNFAGFNFWSGPVDRQIRIFAGDLLLAWSGTPGTSFGAHIWSGPNGVLNQHIFLVHCNENRIEKRYCLHAINSQLDALISRAHGGVGLQHFTKNVIEDLLIPLPPLDEQRRIVRLLDRAAEIRRRADAARTKARAIIPALFLDMFGDPATNPKGWDLVPLSDLLDRIEGGWSPTCDNIPPPAGAWGVLKLSAVKASGFDPTEAKHLPDQTLARPDLEVRNGDLLFSRKNTLDLVGTAAVVTATQRHLMLPDTIFRLCPAIPARFAPRYVCELINLASFRPSIRQLASGSAASMPGISKGRLMKLMIPLPPLPLQTAFAEQVTRIEAVARGLDAAAAKAEAMAAALSAEVFG